MVSVEPQPDQVMNDVAIELTPHVLQIAGADHNLRLPGRLARSTEVLGRMVTAVEGFLDEIVWPR